MSDPIKLSKVERLMLANQYRILERLYPDDDYGQAREALESGYELHYEWILEHIADGLTADKCRDAIDIIEMYARLQQACQDHHESLSDIINDVVFPGFDWE